MTLLFGGVPGDETTYGCLEFVEALCLIIMVEISSVGIPSAHPVLDTEATNSIRVKLRFSSEYLYRA